MKRKTILLFGVVLISGITLTGSAAASDGDDWDIDLDEDYGIVDCDTAMKETIDCSAGEEYIDDSDDSPPEPWVVKADQCMGSTTTPPSCGGTGVEFYFTGCASAAAPNTVEEIATGGASKAADLSIRDAVGDGFKYVSKGVSGALMIGECYYGGT